MSILNLTQHQRTTDQTAAGVVESTTEDKYEIIKQLTFPKTPSFEELNARATRIADITVLYDAHFAMIGGAGFFIPHLERALFLRGIIPVHAFSVRKSVETVKEDGTVVKTTEFVREGFVEAINIYQPSL